MSKWICVNTSVGGKAIYCAKEWNLAKFTEKKCKAQRYDKIGDAMRRCIRENVYFKNGFRVMQVDD